MSNRALWFFATVAISVASAQTPFRMKYLGDVGHLAGLDPRPSANLGVARVFPEPNGDLRFEGRDATGKPWHVWLEGAGGVGGTDVWRADLDRNGHQDLLISTLFPRSGHCTDGITLYALMFDQTGRPVPWVMPSHTFVGYDHPPLGIVKENGRGRAKIITVSCEYSNELATGVSEDRRISGIYEARDARWFPMQNGSDVNRLGNEDPHFVRWLPTNPSEWPDFLAGYDDRPLTQLRSLLTAAVGCLGVRIPVVNGRVVRPVHDPCDSLQHNQIEFSDGELRQGWPSVVIDSNEGREVFLSKPDATLMRLLKMGYRFKALGNLQSPSLLWVDTRAGAQSAPVSSQLKTWEPKRIPLAFEKELPRRRSNIPDLTVPDLTVNVEQRCFVLRIAPDNSARMAPLPDCPDPPRTFRNWNGEEIQAQRLVPVAGSPGVVIRAVGFLAGWLAQWQSGSRRWLVWHSADGKPLTGEMAIPSDEYLVEGLHFQGLYFLQWENEKPGNLILVPASVEWSRALQ